MRRLRKVSALVGFMVLTAGPAFAQAVGATTGAIDGKVSDATGGIMPGVTITIAVVAGLLIVALLILWYALK